MCVRATISRVWTKNEKNYKGAKRLAKVQIFIDFITNPTTSSSDRPLDGIQAFNFDYIDLSKTGEA